MSTNVRTAMLTLLIAVTTLVAVATLGGWQTAMAQDATPDVQASPVPASDWPTGDDLRRRLQEIDFTFRADRETGEWLGWAPRATIVESPALRLDADGRAAAVARFRFDLLQTDLLGGDVDAALTAFGEVVARLPFGGEEAERMRSFVVGDLLVEPPETLEACYSSVGTDGAVFISIDPETGVADLSIGPDLETIGLAEDLDPSTCETIRASGDGPAPGEPTSERITIGTTTDGPTRFEPAEIRLEGTLVTVILTFQNDADAVQTLTFGAPLEADTGPVEPGERRLIVIRQLAPGDYPFYSSSDPDAMTGLVRIVDPEAASDSASP